MKKYDPLTDHLDTLKTMEVRYSFHRVEEILGAKLPKSAQIHQAWWANNKVEGRHSYGWLNAGWETDDVDQVGAKVTFVKK